MKIAFVTTMTGYQWGGSEELWCQAAEIAINDGHEICACIFDWNNLHPKIISLKEKGATILIRKIKHGNFHYIEPVRFYKRVWRKIFRLKETSLNPFSYIPDLVKWNPDLVCVSCGGTHQNGEYYDLYTTLIKQNIKYCILNQFQFENGSLTEDFRIKIGNAFKKAESVFFVSKRNLEVTERQLAKKIDNGKVVSNPYNLTINKNIPYPQSEKLQIACVARLESLFKGQDLLLEALKIIQFEEINFVINFYGKGPDLNYLMNLTSYLNLSDKVVFHDHIDNLSDIWKINQILILPSLGEGTPLALIEAMLSGRTAIVTDVGGNTELIEDGINGFIIAAPTPKLIAETLKKALQNKNKWEEYGKLAYLKVKKVIPELPANDFANKLYKL